MRILVAILVVIAVGIAVPQMLGGDAIPPAGTLPTERSPTAQDSAAPATANGYDPARANDANWSPESGGAERAPAASQAIGLTGHALDHRGEPLGDLAIRLLAEGAHDRDALWTRTDATGAFAFADVHGKFECALWNYVQAKQKVEVPRGEHRDITLQVAEPCILVTGTVRAGTRAVADRTVGVHGKDERGDVHHDAHTDEHGTYRHLLRPGQYTISVVGPPTSIAWNIKGTTVWAETATRAMAEEPLDLAAVPTRVRRNFQLPSARLNVIVQDLNGKPVGDASITIHETSQRNRTWTRRTDAGDGTITFAELPAGSWELVARHQMHLPTEPRIVATRTGDSDQTVRVTMVPAGTVLVKFMQNGDLREPLNPAMLELHAAGHKPRTGHRGQGPMWIYEGIRFEAVPAGTHELICTDHRLPNGTIRFAPIEPISPRPITVDPGKTVTTTMEVVSRPHLAISLAGELDPTTSIQVSSTQGIVAATHRGHDHWRAEVPAGDYEVVVKSGDREHREQVSVFRSNVDHTINLLP